MMIERAASKVNLFLHVGPVKPNGRHALDSLVLFARGETVFDEISVETLDVLKLTVNGAHEDVIGPPEKNLVMRAATALKETARVSTGAHITLNKRLPIAAGIGGGSADAAAALRALCKLWSVDESIAEGIAPALGGDVPVALANVPAFMRGEGERVERVGMTFSVPAVLINPNVPCPTGAVFHALDAMGEREPFSEVSLPDFTETSDSLTLFVNWLTVQENHLEVPAIELCPEIGDVLRALESFETVLVARMSGSGATCFGVFETLEAAHDTAAALRLAFPNWWIAPCELGAG